MKAEFDEKGTLVIKAEDHLEAVALGFWDKQTGISKDHPHFEVDTESFRNVVMAVGYSLVDDAEIPRK